MSDLTWIDSMYRSHGLRSNSMNSSEFLREWGEPDSNNFAISAEEYSGDLFVKICKPRREMIEEVIVYNCRREDVHDYLQKSLREMAEKIGMTEMLKEPTGGPGE